MGSETNYPYEYGRMKARCEEQTEEIKKFKNLLFDYAYRNPRNKAIQNLVKDSRYYLDYTEYCLIRKRKVR